MPALTHTTSTVVVCNWFEWYFDSLVGVKANFVNETVQSFLVKDCFDFAEHCFDRIKFGTIGNVVDRNNI